MSNSLNQISEGYKQLKEQGKSEEETEQTEETRADQEEEQEEELSTEEQLDLLGKSIIQLKEEIKELKGNGDQ